MDSIFDTWKTKIPNYAESFQKELFDLLSQTGGGAEKSKIDLGKHFANNYEFYMYSFFLGLDRDERTDIEDKKKNFKHAIQFWGSKTGVSYRKDFTKLQDFVFMACIAKTEDLDLIALEKGEIDEKEVIRQLLDTMEEYTNGGLTLIKEKLEDNPSFFLQPTGFMDFILG